MLEFGSPKANGSVFQDVSAPLAPGFSATFSVWVRARTGRDVACVVLWGLGARSQEGATCRVVTTRWTEIAAPYDVTAGGLDRLRAQVYSRTAGQHLDLAGASLTGVY